MPAAVWPDRTVSGSDELWDVIRVKENVGDGTAYKANFADKLAKSSCRETLPGAGHSIPVLEGKWVKRWALNSRREMGRLLGLIGDKVKEDPREHPKEEEPVGGPGGQTIWVA